MKTPILLLVFNRPDQTRQVFERIKELKPQSLYIAADGARANREDDRENCKKVREIVSDVDWQCDVNYLFRDENLGCGKAVSSAISWFFDNVEFGIILEDDCLPEIPFFSFCEILLEKYKDSTNIMHISGYNLQNGVKWGDGSYYFSSWVYVWGWATWRRAWKQYDYSIDHNNIFKNLNKIRKNYDLSWKEAFYWWRNFERSKTINTWDYQWVYTVLKNNGLSIVPQYNFIKNIGFTEGATHTSDNSTVVETKTVSEFIEMIHPKDVSFCREADKNTFDIFTHSTTPFLIKVFNKIKTAFS